MEQLPLNKTSMQLLLALAMNQDSDEEETSDDEELDNALLLMQMGSF